MPPALSPWTRSAQFVLDIGRGHHWYGSLGPRHIDESLFDSSSTFLVTPLLACLAFFSESGTHSKAPFVWNSEDILLPTLFQNLWGFSSPFFRFLPPVFLSRLVGD